MVKTYRDLFFEEVQEKDIEILAPIMKRAFDEDTKMHLEENVVVLPVMTMVIFYAAMHLMMHQPPIKFQKTEKS